MVTVLILQESPFTVLHTSVDRTGDTGLATGTRRPGRSWTLSSPTTRSSSRPCSRCCAEPHLSPGTPGVFPHLADQLWRQGQCGQVGTARILHRGGDVRRCSGCQVYYDPCRIWVGEASRRPCQRSQRSVKGVLVSKLNFKSKN